MKSIRITPRNKKEFDIAFSLIVEFGKERNRLSLEEDDDISFAFLMKDTDSVKEDAGKVVAKKIAR